MTLLYENSEEGRPKLDPSTAYFLKVSHSRSAKADNSVPGSDDIVTVNFEVDPSVSLIPDEHLKFAKYLKERFLTIDIFDAETMFYFGTCKFPLFETMR